VVSQVESMMAASFMAAMLSMCYMMMIAIMAVHHGMHASSVIGEVAAKAFYAA
jgi:hypothetical protein